MGQTSGRCEEDACHPALPPPVLGSEEDACHPSLPMAPLGPASGLEELLGPLLQNTYKCEDGVSNLQKFSSWKSWRGKCPKPWVQGRNCGAYVRRGLGGGIEKQWQVILINAHSNCHTLLHNVRVVLSDYIKPAPRSE